MQLGHCKRCSGGLHVVTRLKADAEGRVVGRDGRPLRTKTDPEGRPIDGAGWDGVAAQESVVCCGSCGLADREHVYQKEIDQAARDREAREAAAPKAAVRSVQDYSAADAAVALDRRMQAMEREIERLRGDVAALKERPRSKAAVG